MARKSKTHPKPKAAKSNTTEAERSKSLCNGCPSLCCKDLVLCIEKPRDKEDINFLKWQLQYDTFTVAVSDHRWYSVTQGTCIYLDENNLCTIYNRRPDKCRRHNPPGCERYGPWYDVLLVTPEDLDAYLARDKQRRNKRRRLKRKIQK